MCESCQIMMAYRSSKQSSTDQTPNMPPPQYSQRNDEEPYYILKINNTFFALGTSILQCILCNIVTAIVVCVT